MLTVIILSTLICALQAQTNVNCKKEITYRLYNQNNPVNYIICDPANLTNCNIDSALESKFLAHGWLGSANSAWVIAVKDQYLLKGPYNIIAVDWPKIAQKNYDESSAATKGVGECIGNFIRQLNIEKGVDYAKVYMIGHSLGAHVMGFAGKFIETFGQIIKRIIGLDPAGLNFVGKPPSKRLYKNDASCIVIIHTDDYLMGNSDTDMGHNNFYPNGGTRLQPGCSSKRKREIKPSEFSCSHTRSAIYFNESISSNRFIATICENYALYLQGTCTNNPTTSMGENCDTSLNGQLLFLKTNSESPYAQG